MTQTVSVQSFDPSKIYDAEGRVIGSISHFQDQYLHRLHKQFYQSTVLSHLMLGKSTILSLEAILYPSDIEHLQKSYNHRIQSLTDIIKPLALHAIETKNTDIIMKLKSLGEHAESMIVNTPWHVPVTQHLYHLAALKQSPQAFIEAQLSQPLNQYIKELNISKRKEAKEISIAHNEKVESINEKLSLYTQKVEAIHQSYIFSHDMNVKELRKIETDRKERWRIFTFLMDLFSGKEKERKGELEQLTNVSMRIVNLSNNRDHFTEQYHHLFRYIKPWNDFNTSKDQLLTSGIVDLDELTRLRDAVITLMRPIAQQLDSRSAKVIKKYQDQAVKFFTELQAVIVEKINQLSTAIILPVNELNALKSQFIFLAEQQMIMPEQFIPLKQELITSIRAVVENSLENNNSPEEALKVIGWLEGIGEDAIKAFDIKIYQMIQDRKQYYNHWIFMIHHWDSLLDDNKTSQLSEKEVDDFIECILWLTCEKKQEGYIGSEYIKNLLKVSNQQEISTIQTFVNERFNQFNAKLFENIKILTYDTVAEVALKALKNRLAFLSTNNTRYSEQLHHTRNAMITNVKDYINHETDPVKLNRYMKRFVEVWPGLENDAELSIVFKQAKEKIIQTRFTSQQQALHTKYKTELEFLRTGDPGLRSRFIAKVSFKESVELNAENVERYGKKFIQKYVAELFSIGNDAILFAEMNYSQSEEADARDKVFGQCLKELLRNDIQSIARPLSIKLVQLTDLRRKQALEKLDRIFGLMKDQAINMTNEVVLPLFALAEYQRYFVHDHEMNTAAVDVIRQFNELLQDNKAIGKEFIAKLPLVALNQLYHILEKNPDITIIESADAFSLANNDIIGRASTEANKIQVPRYLLLRMILEFIATDFSALLFGKNGDTKRLNEWIEFAIPKLQKQQQEEEELSQSVVGNKLKEQMLSVLDKQFALNELMQDMQFNAILTKLRNDLENPSVNVIDIINQFPESVIREFPAAEADMLRQINYRFAPWFIDLMTKTLDQHHVSQISQTPVQAMMEVKPLPNKQQTPFLDLTLFNMDKKVKAVHTVKSPAERLRNALQLIDSKVFNDLITMLVNGDAEKRQNLAYLYQLKGVSAPIDIARSASPTKLRGQV